MDAYCCALEQESLLHLSGPDSLKFLQGQTTCDTGQVDDTHALLGAYCNPQGRMVCDFLLCTLGDDHYGLRMRRDIIERSAATFGKFIVFSKAELATDNSDWQNLALWGSNIRDTLATLLTVIPGEKLGTTSGEGYVLVQIDEASTQFECYINIRTNADLLAQLTAALTRASESEWQSLQIESGIGRIQAATVEQFIPQMLNYDITGHVNFKKGCYTGQEVVARMHYRGKPKRRLYLASLGTGDAPPAGTALFSDGSQQSVGNVVNSAHKSDTEIMTLVVATEGGIEEGLRVEAVDGPLLEIAALPYPMVKP